MCFFGRKKKNPELTEVAGIDFRNRLGLLYAGDTPYIGHIRRCQCGFLTLTPSAKEYIPEWITDIQKFRKHTVLAVNLRTDILHSFALVYDFADLIIIDPDTDDGISSADISDMTTLLDEIVSLRLCYEHYTPVFLRLSRGDTPEEIQTLCSDALLAGLDGIVVPEKNMVRRTIDCCTGHVPVIGHADTPEDAREELREGAALIETSLRPIAFSKMLKTL